MIITYLNQNSFEPQLTHEINQALLKKALWVDLLCPSPEETKAIDAYLGVHISIGEKMREIEPSSRLYQKDSALFMTASMLAQSNSPEPKYDAVIFILMPNQLITIRYIEPLAFKLFTSQLQKLNKQYPNATALFIGLLDATIDRLADILEMVGLNLDEYSKTIFRPQKALEKKLDYQQLLRYMGVNGDINAKARESLLTFNRVITFFDQKISTTLSQEEKIQLATLSKDINALSDHANFLSNKINFLLDAILGMVSIEQNKIIKILSVAAVIFLPPTLIASIYGMNFKFIPGLSLEWGSYFALGLMLLSAWLPYKFFKWQKWL